MRRWRVLWKILGSPGCGKSQQLVRNPRYERSYSPVRPGLARVVGVLSVLDRGYAGFTSYRRTSENYYFPGNSANMGKKEGPELL